jgi:hypothetical protein
MNLICKLNRLFLLMFLFSIFFWPSKLLLAGDIDQNFLEKISSTYLSYTTLDHSMHILKPSNQHALTLWPRCITADSKKCTGLDITRKLRSSIIRNENNLLEYSKSNPDISVIFADRQIVRAKLAELDETYATGFRDSEDLECALYYQLNDSIISKIVIIISLDAREFKQRMCLANQFFRGLGLSLGSQKTFSELWDSGAAPLSRTSEDEFSKLVDGLSIFTLIHMCRQIVPGMSRQEVLTVLEKNICLRGLTTKN